MGVYFSGISVIFPLFYVISKYLGLTEELLGDVLFICGTKSLTGGGLLTLGFLTHLAFIFQNFAVIEVTIVFENRPGLEEFMDLVRQARSVAK